MKPPVEVDLFWFEDCPNRLLAYAMICDVGAELGMPLDFAQIEVPDEAAGLTVRFPVRPRSPTASISSHAAHKEWRRN